MDLPVLDIAQKWNYTKKKDGVACLKKLEWLLFSLSVSTEHIIQFYKSQWFLFLPYRCAEYQGGGCSSTSGLTAMYHGRTTGKGPSTPAQIYQQPPRLLIVHISLPSWADICSNLCEAMQNFFSLACSLMGPSRMSLFSLYMVQNQHECILPFVVSISVFVHFILKVIWGFCSRNLTSQLLLLTAIVVPVPMPDTP